MEYRHEGLQAAPAKALKGILDDLQAANCERLSSGKAPILPVALHYFMKESDGSARPIPAEVLKTTQKTLSLLRMACKKDN